MMTLGQRILRQAEQAVAGGDFAHAGEVFEAKARAVGILPIAQQQQLNRETRSDDPRVREAAQTVFLLCNSRQVSKTIRSYLGRGLEGDDLRQEGAIGQLRGIDKYDQEFGTSPLSYQTWWIRQGSSRAVQKHSEIPSYLYQVVQDIERNLPRLLTVWRHDRLAAAEADAYAEGGPVQLREFDGEEGFSVEVWLEGERVAASRTSTTIEAIPDRRLRALAEEHELTLPADTWVQLPADWQERLRALEQDARRGRASQTARRMARERVLATLMDGNPEPHWTPEDLASAIGAPPEHVERALDLLQRKKVPLDAEIDTGDGSTTFAEMIADPDASTEGDALDELSRTSLRACIGKLPPVQRIIMEWQFGLNGEEPVPQSHLYEPGTRYARAIERTCGVVPSRGFIQSQIRSAKRALAPLMLEQGLARAV